MRYLPESHTVLSTIRGMISEFAQNLPYEMPWAVSWENISIDR